MERPGTVIKDIFDKISALNVHEKRALTEEYCELVFLNKEIKEWENLFSMILGPAVKPPKVKPAKSDLLITGEFGGICVEQTLYRKEYGKESIIAMFWPWKDPDYTTLKVALLKKDKTG